MLRFIGASFLLLGWTFYEASGGAEFAPSASAATSVPMIAPSAEDIPDDVAFLDHERTYGERIVPDAMPVEIVSRTATDLPAVAPLPTPAETVAAPDTRALYAVTGNGVNMRAGPGTSHGVVVTLSLGTEAEVIGSEGNWNNIRLEDGTEGWMSANFLSEL